MFKWWAPLVCLTVLSLEASPYPLLMTRFPQNPRTQTEPPSPSEQPLKAAPASAPCPQSRTGFSLSGSYLLWQASENLSPYAQVVTTEHVIDAEKGIGAPRGHNTSVHYEWASGFNVRGGWHSPYDHWDFFVDWTWYRNLTHNHISSSTESSLTQLSNHLAGTENGKGIYNQWGKRWIPANFVDVRSGLPEPLVLEGPFAKTSVHWDLYYNTGNLEVGKSFITKSNRLRPFFGLQGAWIKRKLKASYTGYANPGSLTATAFALDDFAADPIFTLEGFDSAHVNATMNYWGLGPLLGIFDALLFKYGWNLFGQFSAGFLYGQAHSSEHSSLYHLVNHLPSVFDSGKWTSHSQWSFATHLQGRLGLGWNCCFHCTSKRFYLQAAWEQNLWFFSNFSSDFNQGNMNLSLGGLTATAGVNF